jgi:hypothetical protein
MKTLLHDAYLNTDYHVDAPDGPFKLNIDCYSPELDQLHHKSGVSCSLYITAWNPYSEQLTDEKNRTNQQSLISEINGLGFDLIPGRGVAQSGNWPPEDSILVLGCDENSSIALGQKYQQNAVVFIGGNAIPQLINTK